MNRKQLLQITDEKFTTVDHDFSFSSPNPVVTEVSGAEVKSDFPNLKIKDKSNFGVEKNIF